MREAAVITSDRRGFLVRMVLRRPGSGPQAVNASRRSWTDAEGGP